MIKKSFCTPTVFRIDSCFVALFGPQCGFSEELPDEGKAYPGVEQPPCFDGSYGLSLPQAH